MNEDEEVYVLTPWGRLAAVLEDYGIDCSNITARMGKHLVEDFMESMVNGGYVATKEHEE